MSPKREVMCLKRVTAAQIDLVKIRPSEFSDAIRQVIREANIQSLNGLLTADQQTVAQGLRRMYWGVK